MFSGLKTRLTKSAKALFAEVTGTDIAGQDKRSLDCGIWGASGVQMTVNSEGRGDVVQHAHPNNVNFHFDYSFDTAGTSDFIMVDVSDTTDYKHSNTNYVHVEWMHVEVDASTNADYELQFGFVEDVTDTDSTFYEVFHVSGNKTAGNAKDINLPMYPNGPRMVSDKIITSNVNANDTGFQSDVLLPTLLSPNTSTTYPADGDFVMRVIVTTSDIRVAVHGSYHGH